MENQFTPGLLELIEDYAGELDFGDMADVSLYHDLGIYGDDAYELLEKYSELFGVSLAGFNFGNYFRFEGDGTFPAIWRFLKGRKQKEYKRLTLGDLQIGINEKKL